MELPDVHLSAAVLDRLAALVLVFDRAGRIVFFNRACERTTGFTRADVLGRSVWELFVPPDEVAAARDAIDRLWSGTFPNEHENDWLTRDGSRRRIVWTNDVLRAEDGSVQYVVGSGLDVTDRHRAEQVAAETERQYRGIFEATSDGLIVNDLSSGRVVEVNPAFCRMHGYTRDELLGAHPRRFIHPSSLHLFSEYVEAVRSGEEFRSSALDVRKDGSSINVEVLGRAFVFQGQPAVLGVVRDITEQVRAFDLLERRVEERTRELRTLYGADEALHQSLHVHEVLEALVDVATSVFHADKAGVMLWDERHERLVPRIGRGFGPEFMAHVSFTPGQGVAGRVAQTGQTEAVSDLLADPRVNREQIVAAGIRSIIYAPILIREELFGIFSVDWEQPRAFDAGEPRLMQALAERAAVAIENARLFEQAEQAGALEERQKLARELHDSVSQALYGIALGAQTALGALEEDRDIAAAVEPVRYVLGLAEAGLTEMRALIFELRPESLVQEGLVAALGKQAASLRARHGLEVAVDAGHEPDLPLKYKEALYRIAQEALHNIVKHAHATRVDLRLACAGETVRLEICDDGQGFDPTGSFPGHLGMRSMRERVERLGGTLDVQSAAGCGTRLLAEVSIGGAAGSIVSG